MSSTVALNCGSYALKVRVDCQVEFAQKHIGQRDEIKGDQMVCKEDIYQWIIDVKTIHSDLRHDLDHGKPNDVKKKMKSVGECYKKHCGNRPLKPRYFKKLQGRIYDKVIELEETLI